MEATSFTVLMSIIALMPWLYYEAGTWTLWLVKVTTGTNSDDEARRLFIALVRGAKDEIRLYDDGEPGSMYDEPDVIAAVEKQLEAHPSLRIWCVFTHDGETNFRKAFAGEERVQFSTKSIRSDIHYRIIDDGKIGYLSRHTDASEERRPYRRYDASKVPARWRAAAIANTLRKYLDDNRRQFEAPAYA